MAFGFISNTCLSQWGFIHGKNDYNNAYLVTIYDCDSAAVGRSNFSHNMYNLLRINYDYDCVCCHDHNNKN